VGLLVTGYLGCGSVGLDIQPVALEACMDFQRVTVLYLLSPEIHHETMAAQTSSLRAADPLEYLPALSSGGLVLWSGPLRALLSKPGDSKPCTFNLGSLHGPDIYSGVFVARISSLGLW
jgi:hypothetical protein